MLAAMNRLHEPYTSAPLCWWNGELIGEPGVPLAIDADLLRGDGVFETMRVAQGSILALERHIDRLVQSCMALAIPTPDEAALVAGCTALLEATGRDAHAEAEFTFRVTVTASTQLVQARPLPDRVRSRREGLRLWCLDEPRLDGLVHRHKTLGWGGNAMHTRRHPRGADPRFEGLWLGEDGRVLEGMSTSIFGARTRDGHTVVYTAPLSEPILPGVTRAFAIEASRASGFDVVEARFDLAFLKGCDEVFATSATLPIAPVVELDGAARPAGPIVRALRNSLTSV
jgi:branched-subunit amino acid aminotransferase/4-amino-4-deoxychorismate lyase